VFVSYSHKDKAWLELLRTHLAPLVREGMVYIWDDTQIQAGALWREELDAALERARVAVLMISADFLGSAFIRDNELPPLLTAADADGCHVLPLLLRPSLFQETPELRRFQAVNPDAVPLSQLAEPKREEVLVSLARRIMALVGRAP
jgi:TIR domain